MQKAEVYACNRGMLKPGEHYVGVNETHGQVVVHAVSAPQLSKAK